MFVLDQPPRSWLDVAVVPGLALFFGLLIFGLGARVEATGGRARWKWLGFAVLLLGLYNGLEYFWNFVGTSLDASLYRSVVTGRKMLVAHLFAFFGPLLGIAAIVGYTIWLKRKPKFEL